VGIRQVGRKGRLRAPGGGYRAHGHTTHQADQEDHGEVAAAALVKAGPEMIPRDPEGPPDHGGIPVGRYTAVRPTPIRVIKTLPRESGLVGSRIGGGQPVDATSSLPIRYLMSLGSMSSVINPLPGGNGPTVCPPLSMSS
jgi:hypothetical protein